MLEQVAMNWFDEGEMERRKIKTDGKEEPTRLSLVLVISLP